jgi:hypothetical protein
MMQDLIEKLGKATGPDWRLDHAIFAHVRGWTLPLAGAAFQEFADLTREHGRTNYTASIDAAMTLVPDGWQVDNWFIGTDKSSRLDLRNLTSAKPLPLEMGAHDHSAAIALCIAALKARAGLHQQAAA